MWRCELTLLYQRLENVVQSLTPPAAAASKRPWPPAVTSKVRDVVYTYLAREKWLPGVAPPSLGALPGLELALSVSRVDGHRDVAA